MSRHSIFSDRLSKEPQFEFTPQEMVANRMFALTRDIATPEDFKFFHDHILGWNTAKDIGQKTPKMSFNKVAQRKILDGRLLIVAGKVCASEGIKVELGPILINVDIEGAEISPKHLARVAMVDFGLNPSVPEAERFERMATIIGGVEDKSKILGSN